jgi:hypothetical protein
MEAAWRALAEEQNWLDGEVSPVRANGKSLPQGGGDRGMSGEQNDPSSDWAHTCPIF